MGENFYWQGVGMKKVVSHLRFDIHGFRDFCPNVFKSTDTVDMVIEKMKKLPKTELTSQLYKIQYDEVITEWQILVNFQISEGKPSLGVYLTLVRSYERSNSSESCGSSILVPVHAQHNIDLMDANDSALYEGPDDLDVFSESSNNWGYHRLAYLYDIWSDKELFLVEDTLRIRVKLTILTSGVWCNTNDTQQQPRMEMLQDVSKLLSTGEGSDAVIKCGWKMFLVHRTILTARSLVFGTMFKSGLSEAQSNTIVVEDIEPDVLQLLLAYIYSGTLDFQDVSQEHLIGVVQASDKYQLDGLKQICLHQLICNVNLKNAGDIAVLVHLHSIKPEDKHVIFQYCSRNWQQLASDRDFQDLVKAYPAAFFGGPNT